MASMNAVIQATELTRDFGEIRAVDGLSFSVSEGEVYGFLGQNGAGKSTTIRMLLTLVKPSSGDIQIFGMNLYEHRREILKQVGAIIERPDLYKYLTALENLRIFAAMSGVRLSEEKLLAQLEFVGLADRARSKVKTYSQGMKQRLGIATALVHNPRLIILDEPINGLDPQGIADVRKLILHLSKDLGKTIFVSSHVLNEMELVADSMLIIDKGKKVAEGTKEELLNPVKTIVELVTDDKENALRILAGTQWQKALIPENNGADKGTILFEIEKNQVGELSKTISEKGISILSFRPKHSLEDFFLSLTKH